LPRDRGNGARLKEQVAGYLLEVVTRPWGLIGLACALAMSGCVAPARTFTAYQADAVTTAEESQSAIETALLASRTAARGHAYGNYLSAVLGDTEDSGSAVQSSFDSEQPPDGAADGLRTKLDLILQDANSILVALRIHARRGEIGRLAAIARPLQGISRKLDDFIKAQQQ
jgi:hypothetical protein